MNQNMLNAQNHGDRYGHGTASLDASNLSNNVNSAPFSNPYEGKKVLMEGEETNQLNEHNVYAKAQANKQSFHSSGDTSMINEDEKKIKMILYIGLLILALLIISVLLAVFL